MFNKKLTLLCSGLLITGILFTGCSTASVINQVQQTAKAAENNSELVTVAKGEIKETLSLSGSLATKDKDTLTAGEKTTVYKVYVEQNKKVTKGAKLVTLNSGTVITAPYAGTITKVNVSAGDEVTTETALLNIVDNSDYYINATIDESDIAKVHLAQEVEVNVTALDKKYAGKVSYIAGEATVDGDRASFNIVIDLEGNFEGLYYGLSAAADIIITDAKDVLIVPINAVSVKGQKKYISVKNGDTFVDKEVTVGAQDSSNIAILTGLKENDVIKVTAKKTQNGRFQGGMMPGGNMPTGNMPGGQAMQRNNSQGRSAVTK